MEQKSPLVLGVKPIRKLLAEFALPAIIAMTASSLYNIVDSIFIGHIGQGVGHLAIAGLAVTYPLMNLTAAFGSLVGVGASTLVSVKLGQKDYLNANRVLGNVLVLNIIIGILVAIVSLSFLDDILIFFGASEHTLPFARDFMHVILMGNVVTHMYLGLNSVIRSAGNPRIAMNFTLLSVGINCVLAPIFIFGCNLGITGAALATVIAQTIPLVMQMVYLSKPTQVVGFRKGIYRLKSELVNNILSVGLSPFLMNICACLIVILINRGLKQWDGDVAIAAYGIVNRVVFLFVMVVMGLNQGMQPIAGYNYGARKFSRVMSVTWLTIWWATGVTTFGALVCQLFPHFIASWFTTDQTTISASVYGIRFMFAVFPLVGFQMVTSNFYMSIEKPKLAILLSLTRQMLFLMPCLIFLPPVFHTMGIWISIPISDAAAVVLSIALFGRSCRKYKKKNTL